ncbi:SET domain-containing protein [Paenibacillus silvae]|uniref:SET domain-containing protein n=1 Tax=Paenibacillus silvae TaxID=1325358 RepID=UPI0020049D5C|nr:SET domain-containing protein [Paenibacillus silvae]MCK6073669.1 SET domain-containing protein [Paenibacillus silvae]MCK6148855.1 SET domain-containing protein [Paenibacillus silvae]MCK6267155.1 SET domain-containing protein [Paenibacillus silvae]
MIEVRQSRLGDGGEFNRGVFATVDIAKGQLIHQAPVVPYPNEDHEHIEKTILEDYVFEYGANHTAILLGYGSLINHSYEPNATYDINFENHTFDFYAYTDIKAGEEILINYNGEEDNMDPLWFLDDYEERMREMQEQEAAEASTKGEQPDEDSGKK